MHFCRHPINGTNWDIGRNVRRERVTVTLLSRDAFDGPSVREWAEDVLERLHRAELTLLRETGKDYPENIQALENAAIEDRHRLVQALQGENR